MGIFKKNSEGEKEEEYRILPAGHGSGDRKKTALFAIGGAVLGAFLGDVFYGRDYLIYGDILSNGGTDDSLSEAFFIEVKGTDRGGLIEDYVFPELIDDQYEMTDVYIAYYSEGDDIFIGPEPFNRPIMESDIVNEQSTAHNINLGLSEGTLDQTYTYTGAVGGGISGSIAGGATGYASDRINARLKKKKFSNFL